MSTNNVVNITIVLLYLAAMIGFGFWGKRRTRDKADFLVAGCHLGPLLYTGTMAAVVLGGASTVGGVGLGYTAGLSGLWLVAAIGTGVLLLSLIFASRLQRLRIYTVSQMLQLRYGHRATQASSLVMLGYTLVLCATSTSAYATIFVVLFGWERWVAIMVGGVVVLTYSTIGGMWSITLADMAQFGIKTIGIFALMLPFALTTAHRDGGFEALRGRVEESFFRLDGIGVQTIITYFVVYTLGLLIGQDIWQRVFTARSPTVARWGGATAGAYCILYGIAGALIGMAARVALPQISLDEGGQDAVYAEVASTLLPVGLGGLVLAAAVAAMMSTASGALIAAATVARADVLPFLTGLFRGGPPRTDSTDHAASRESPSNPEHEVRANRFWVLALGLVAILIAILVQDVIAALTIAYDLLVGGLLVAILGGLLWKRGTGIAAGISMAFGTGVTVLSLLLYATGVIPGEDGIYANEPIYFGLVSSLISYVIASLLSPPTDPQVMAAWQDRLSSSAPEPEGSDPAEYCGMPKRPSTGNQPKNAENRVTVEPETR